MITETTTVGHLEALLREAGVTRVTATYVLPSASPTGKAGWRAKLETVVGSRSCTGSSIATAIDRALLRLRGGA